MTVIKSALNSRSKDFKANVRAVEELVDDLREKIATAAIGGGEAARARHVGRGKLLPRDRIRAFVRREIYCEKGMNAY